jgi:hypothetical protein
MPEPAPSPEQSSTPARRQSESVLGFPGLPTDILDWIVDRLPWLVLIGVVASASNAGFIFVTAKNSSAPVSFSTAAYAFLGLATAVILLLGFFWLRQNRLLGWYALALALAIQFSGELFVLSGTSILYDLAELAVTVYLLVQIRGYYSR